MNSVNISGNLTRDPELRSTQGGTAVLTFGVAVNGRRRNPQTGEWEDAPNYIDCVVFGNYATAIQPHIAKGSKVAISGELRYRQWETDGQKRSKIEVVAREVVTMQQQRQQQRQPTPAYATPPAAPPAAPPLEVYDEDIPF